MKKIIFSVYMLLLSTVAVFVCLSCDGRDFPVQPQPLKHKDVKYVIRKFKYLGREIEYVKYVYNRDKKLWRADFLYCRKDQDPYTQAKIRWQFYAGWGVHPTIYRSVFKKYDSSGHVIKTYRINLTEVRNDAVIYTVYGDNDSVSGYYYVRQENNVLKTTTVTKKNASNAVIWTKTIELEDHAYGYVVNRGSWSAKYIFPTESAVECEKEKIIHRDRTFTYNYYYNHKKGRIDKETSTGNTVIKYRHVNWDCLRNDYNPMDPASALNVLFYSFDNSSNIVSREMADFD